MASAIHVVVVAILLVYPLRQPYFVEDVMLDLLKRWGPLTTVPSSTPKEVSDKTHHRSSPDGTGHWQHIESRLPRMLGHGS